MLLGSCEQTLQTSFYPDQPPQKLSAWQVLKKTTSGLRIADDAMVYDLNTALFSDYASKLRTLHVPRDKQATYEDGELIFPVGTVVSKTFLYETNEAGHVSLDNSWQGDPAQLDPNSTRLLETRLLVNTDQGWQPHSYVWAEGDADYKITGELIELATTGEPAAFSYLVPSRNQCASCHATNHTTGELKPIGLQVRHLHKASPVSGTNQLVELTQRGWLTLNAEVDALPANADYSDPEAELAHRARSYLDINCGHCHNPEGAADTSGLLLHYGNQDLAAMGQCKPPIAAGRGSGGFMYSIVPGESSASIMTHRMRTQDPGQMMPELGRALTHIEGTNVTATWIDQMRGKCE
ncbi:MAG: SO2930 family diheme c-type cytochrome [Pseudomonadota bacterium]